MKINNSNPREKWQVNNNTVQEYLTKTKSQIDTLSLQPRSYQLLFTLRMRLGPREARLIHILNISICF